MEHMISAANLSYGRNPMDFFDIEAFTVLAEAGSFSAAAKKLCVTQPALSQRIRRLEDYLGYSLLVRQRGRLSIDLTRPGEEFLGLARQMLQLCEKARSLGSEETQKTLRLSINETIATCTIPNAVQTFITEHPDVHLALHSYYSRESYDLISTGELDVAIVSQLLSHTPSVNLTPLLSEPWLFVCGKDAGYPAMVHPKDLDPAKLLVLCNVEKTVWYKYWFAANLQSAMDGYTLTFLNEAAFRDGNWAVLPCSIARHYEKQGICAIRELEVSPKPRIIYALTRSDNLSEPVQQFLECASRELLEVPGVTPLF